MEDNKKTNEEIVKEINQILGAFYNEKMTPEARKFTLLLITKFIPTKMKKDTLKNFIESLDDKSTDQLIEMLIDTFSSDEMAKKIREMIKEMNKDYTK